MKLKSYGLLAAILGFAPLLLFGQSAPHDFGCTPCHRHHLQPSAEGPMPAGNPELCVSCHNPAGTAADVGVGYLEQADPYGTRDGSSHAWGVPPANERAQTLDPLTPGLASRLRDGVIVCSTCHNQHSHAEGEPFLRVSNAGDAMCLDCHRPRDLGRWQDNPAENIGSHPVRVTLDGDRAGTRIPGEGDGFLPLSDGQVVCTTCHAPHNATSTTSLTFHATAGDPGALTATVNGAGWSPGSFAAWEALFPSAGANQRERRTISTNTTDTITWLEPLPAPLGAGDVIVLQQPGTGDGTLLRTANDDSLCKACHTYPDHPPGEETLSCRSCHQPHGGENILLVKDSINDRAVTYRSHDPLDFVHGAPNYDGVCEVCHTRTQYHQNNAAGDHTHNMGANCTACHPHSSSFQPQCGSCHPATPETLASGSHATHFTGEAGPHLAQCSACHGAGADNANHGGHMNGIVNFGGQATQSLATTAVCDECHSPGGPFDGVEDPNSGAKALWPDGAYASPGVLRPGALLWCAGCHDDDPGTPENESAIGSGIHAPSKSGDNATFGFYIGGHGRSNGAYPAESWQAPGAAGNPHASLDCAACHDATASHLDGQTSSGDRLREGFAPGQNNGACSRCHDTSIAWAAPEYYRDSASFETSGHSGYLCTSCHDVHGTVGTFPAMALGNEESLCASCHAEVMDKFARNSHHDISDAEQAQHGSRIECTMCHNPHVSNSGSPLIDLANPAAVLPGGVTRDFCLLCHDGAAPAAVQFPAQAPGSGWNQSGYGDHPQTGPQASCADCHDPHGSSNLLLVGGQIRGRNVIFTNRETGFVNGPPNFNGVCEVCHTQTSYHQNNAAGDHTHNTGAACTACHEHEEEFLPVCGSCHDATPETLRTGSHASHFTAANGPKITDCSVCHGAGASQGSHAGHLNGTVNFSGGAAETLQATAACNTCHSPGGIENGVILAKPAWADGVYLPGGELQSGYELWCASCHDDDPATPGVNESSAFGALFAPAIAGDGASYGYYVTGHGREGGAFAAMSWQPPGADGNPAPGLACGWCHDSQSAHLDGVAHSQTRLQQGFEPDQENTGCNVCHSRGSVAVNPPDYYDYSETYEDSAHGPELCSACHNVHGAAAPEPAMAVRHQEALCLGCHEDVAAEFGKTSHHGISDQDQADGTHLECTMCHNPHVATEEAPLASPDDLTAPAAAGRGFCIACHDGDPPDGVRFPAQSPGTSWDQSGYGDHPHSEPLFSCVECHEGHGSTNLLLVTESINARAVTFPNRTTGFVQAAAPYNGICEVCHTGTDFHRNNASGDHAHNVGTACTACHAHEDEFATNCGSCHAVTPATLTTGSHAAHFTNAIGPRLTSCEPCHGAGADTASHTGHNNGTVDFPDGARANLQGTHACDACHSPAGAANGVTEAKAAWDEGVYLAPGQLGAGHDRWCLSCHDDNPLTVAVNESASIGGLFAPAIAGDNSTYGYYITGHGRSGSRFPAMSWQAPGANGNPASGMTCAWCHDAASGHLDGAVHSGLRLKPGFQADQQNTGCNQCHRAGGPATAQPAYYGYSDEFEASAHGPNLCTECHNPHGSSSAAPAMGLRAEELLCASCHDGVMQEFAAANHHDVNDTDQLAHGSRLECTMCHNPHIATKEVPLANPDDPGAAWTEVSSRDFCLACHDGEPPAAAAFPAAALGTGWNQSDFIGTRHDEVLGGECELCHNPHGSANLAMLSGAYSVGQSTPASEAAYQACFDCHDYPDTINDSNAFFEHHKKHVSEEHTPCIACHNVHAPHDAGESGLIDFAYPLAHGFDMTLSAGGNGYDLSTSFLDEGTDRGRCFLTCHDESHSPSGYAGVRVSTVDCLQCHETAPQAAE